MFSISHAYGIAVDPTTGDVWQTLYDEGFLIRWDSDGRIELDGGSPRLFANGGGFGKGLVIGDDGHVWVAHSQGNTVGHLDGAKNFINTVGLSGINPIYDARRLRQDPAGSPTIEAHCPHGVSIDNNGKIWAVNYRSDTAMRINPTGNGGIGAVEHVTDLDLNWDPETEGAWPYNYSDMTGFNNHIVNPGLIPQKGYWLTIQDSGTEGMEWEHIQWNTETASAHGKITVHIRASDERRSLSSNRFQSPANGSAITGVRGRFLEIRVALVRDCDGNSPVFSDLQVSGRTASLRIEQEPTDFEVVEGASANFSVTASGADPLTYQWYFQDKLMAGEVGPTITIPEVHLLHEGLYRVVVSDGVGSIVTSKSARLMVDPATIVIRDGTAPWAHPYPATIVASGLSPNMSGVTVTISNLLISHVLDLKLLVVGPNGNSVPLLAHAGGNNAVSDLSLTFDDHAANMLSSSDQPISGAYRPSVYLQAFGMPSPAPVPTHTSLTSAFGGSTPNGRWKLYVCDDHAEQNPSFGKIVGSWNIKPSPSLSIVTQPSDQAVVEGGKAVFSVDAVGLEPLHYSWTAPTRGGTDRTLVVSPVKSADAGSYRVRVTDATGAIVDSRVATLTIAAGKKVILDAYKASPYPTERAISSPTSIGSRVTVTLNHFKHPRAHDVTMLLVGPNGNAVTLMHQADSGSDATDDLNLTFDSASGTGLPADFPSTGSVIYHPSGTMSLDLPSPAPAPTHSSLTAAFTGSDPRGTWKLYIYDTLAGPCSAHAAEIESWNLTFY